MFWTGVAGFFTLLALVPLVLVLVYVIFRGFARLDWAAFTELPPPPLADNEGGFANALVGTLIMVSIGALVSVPFGVLAAIYLSEFSRGRVPRWIRFATNVLSGVPSILMGVFIYGLFVITIGTYSAVAGGLALGVLMLPIIVRTTDESLQIVPRQVRWAAVGSGRFEVSGGAAGGTASGATGDCHWPYSGGSQSRRRNGSSDLHRPILPVLVRRVLQPHGFPVGAGV